MFNRFFNYIASPTTSLIFVGLMFFLPFTIAIHHNPIPTFYSEWASVTLGLLACLALLNKSFWQDFKIPQISLVFLGLSTILGMQLLLGMLHSWHQASLILSYLLWAFLLVFLGSYLRRELGWEKIAITLAWCLLLGALIDVFYVALQIALKSGVKLAFMPKFPGYGVMAQANNTADYTGLALASLIYLYAKNKLNIKWLGLGLALFITLLAFTGSRSTYLYLGVLTILAIGLQIKAIRQQNGSPKIRSLVRTSLILIPLFLCIQWLLQNTLPDALINLPSERLEDSMAATTGSARFQIWFDSWRLAIQSPWLGIGAGQMRWQSFMLLDSPTPNSFKRVFEHAHNLFLHLFTEMGILAVLIALVGIIAWMRAFKWRELNLETWWLIAILAIIGIHSQLEYPLWYAFFLGILAFLMGAGEEKFTSFTLRKAGRISAVSILSIVFVVGTVNLGTLIVAFYKLEYQIKTSVIRGKIVDPVQYDKDIKWAYDYSTLRPYASAIIVSTMKPDEAQLDAQLALSEKAMQITPYKFVIYRHALLLELKGDQAGAEKQLKRALIAVPVKKVTQLLLMIPKQYWDQYLGILNAVRPLKKIPRKDYNPMQQMKREEQQKQAQEK